MPSKMTGLQLCCNEEYLLVSALHDEKKKIYGFVLIRISTGEIIKEIKDEFDGNIKVEKFTLYGDESKSMMATFTGKAMHLFSLPDCEKTGQTEHSFPLPKKIDKTIPIIGKPILNFILLSKN